MPVHTTLVASFLLSTAAMLPDAPSAVPEPAPDPARAVVSAPVVPAPRAGWTWPIAPRPVVVRRFAVGPQRWSAGHRGVDLAAAPGGVVRAASAGVVRFAAPLAGRTVVVIMHDGGVRTTYEPVDAEVVRGQRVSAGQPIGRLQGAGSHCTAATCLHWGAIRGQTYLDPLSLLARRSPPVLLPLARSPSRLMRLGY